jgi:hypothetical protein
MRRRPPFGDQVFELQGIPAGRSRIVRGGGQALGFAASAVIGLLRPWQRQAIRFMRPFIKELDAVFRFAFELRRQIVRRVADGGLASAEVAHIGNRRDGG